MGRYDIRNYFPTLQEWMRYNGGIEWDDYSVMKDHGDYVQLMIHSTSVKGHDTYDLYFDSDGILDKAYGHPDNVGFVGWKKLRH